MEKNKRSVVQHAPDAILPSALEPEFRWRCGSLIKGTELAFKSSLCDANLRFLVLTMYNSFTVSQQ